MITALILPLVVAYFCGCPLNRLSDAPWLFTIALGITGVCFTMVVGLASGDRDLLRLPDLADRILLYLGSRSYGIYALHISLNILGWTAIVEFMPWLDELRSKWRVVVHAVVTMPTLLLVAELSYRFVERPCIRLSARLIAAMTKNGGGEKDVVEPMPESVKRAA